MVKKKLTTASGRPFITQYSKAQIFSKIDKQTTMVDRFSLVAQEKGSADTERDPRGFALKFYTEDGNWDLVGNNTPIFFIKDPKKFSHLIHTQKRDPKTNCKSPTSMWDFWSLKPESLHQVMILMSEYERKNFVSNIINSMSGICSEKKYEIITRQLCHFPMSTIN